MSKLKSQLASLTYPHVDVAIISNVSWIKMKAYPFLHTKPFFLSQLSQNMSQRHNLSLSPNTQEDL